MNNCLKLAMLEKKNVLQSFKQSNPERACSFPRELFLCPFWMNPMGGHVLSFTQPCIPIQQCSSEDEMSYPVPTRHSARAVLVSFVCQDLLPDQHSTLVMDVVRCSRVLVPWSGEMMRGGGGEQF
ncbi:unnamed protein product [Arctogadus glacialis]